MPRARGCACTGRSSVRAPFSTGWSATLQVGAATFFRPASVIATLIAGWVHVGRADDLLRGDLVLDGVPRVDAHHERANTERDHERAGDDSADSKFCDLSFAPTSRLTFSHSERWDWWQSLPACSPEASGQPLHRR